MTSNDSYSPVYDQIGNPLNWRDGMTLSWARGRRLASVITPLGSISYSYNDSGIRTGKTVSGSTTTFTLSGSKILRQQTSQATVDFYYEGSTLLGFRTANADFWYVRNLQGDIIAILNNSGSVVVTYTYDTWGKVTSIGGSLSSTIGELNPFRYRGYYYDSETGLYYLNARYYDPEVGRFVSADSLMSTGQGVLGNNMYSYCLNNPVKHKDSNGRYVDSIDFEIGGAFFLGLYVCFAYNTDGTDSNISFSLGVIGTTNPCVYMSAGNTFFPREDMLAGDVEGYGGSIQGTYGSLLAGSAGMAFTKDGDLGVTTSANVGKGWMVYIPASMEVRAGYTWIIAKDSYPLIGLVSTNFDTVGVSTYNIIGNPNYVLPTQSITTTSNFTKMLLNRLSSVQPPPQNIQYSRQLIK